MLVSLYRDIQALERFLPDYVPQTVSEIDEISMHLHRVFMTVCHIVIRLDMSDPAQYRSGINLYRSYLLISRTTPKNMEWFISDYAMFIIDTHDLLHKTKKSIKKLYKLPKNSHIVHPDLGGLNKAQAIKLISIYLQNTSKELKQAELGKAKLKYA